jgi:heme peroxidase
MHQGLSRRRFIQVSAGATGTALLAGPLAPVAYAGPSAPEQADVSTRFGRMFPDLEPFATPSARLTSALMDIGRPGGILDADDDLSKGPVLLITDPSLSEGNPNNDSHTAGTTFMGQFLDHDLTFDATSRLGVPTAPESTRNARTPSFDLDSVYGGGPSVTPSLYKSSDRAKFRVESGGTFEDLPRDEDLRATIADQRNDQNLIIAGLHCAFLLFHNRAVDLVRSRPKLQGTDDVFTAARRLTTWHYQWLILREFLPLFVGRRTVGRVMSALRANRVGSGVAMPVEFAGAAYRFGHSMVRPSYRANLKGDKGKPFFGFIFDPAAEQPPDPPDLVGGFRAPRRFIGWQTFFDFEDGEVRPNKRIDTKLSSPLLKLPVRAIATQDPDQQTPVALPQRSLLRQVTWSLPSGQAIAAELGLPRLDPVEELKDYRLGLDRSTPLFYYVLKEAEVMEDGLHLGPVGGRIVAEVFIRALLSDPRSFIRVDPRWRPTLPAGSGEFRMVDFLTFAGVDPASRGQ